MMTPTPTVPMVVVVVVSGGTLFTVGVEFLRGGLNILFLVNLQK